MELTSAGRSLSAPILKSLYNRLIQHFTTTSVPYISTYAIRIFYWHDAENEISAIANPGRLGQKRALHFLHPIIKSTAY